MGEGDQKQLTPAGDNEDASSFRVLCRDWRVLLGAGMCLFLTVGFDKTTSIIAAEFYEHFNQHEVAPVALIFSLKFLLQFSGGPAVAYLCTLLGYPTVVGIGAMLGVVAFGISSCVQEVVWMYSTFSVLVGLSFSMIITSTWSILAVTFTSNRGLAIGISAMIASLGGIAFPQILHTLFTRYLYRGGMILIGINLSHVLVAAMLYHVTIKRVKERDNGNTSKTESSQLIEKPADVEEPSPVDVYGSILSLPLYLGFCVFIVTFMFTHMSVTVHIEKISQQFGLNQQQVLLTLQGISFLDIFTIPLSGLLLDLMGSTRRTVNLYLVLSLVYVFQLFIVLCLEEQGGRTLMATWMFALTFGTIGHTQAVNICSHLVPKQHIPVAVGLLRFFQGFGVLLGPYITGLVTDYSGTFNSVLYVSMAVLGTGATFYLIMFNCILHFYNAKHSDITNPAS